MAKKKNNKNSTSSRVDSAIPVVAVLGHVDHGKTSLLDAIRKTNLAAREHGGITQKIGASSVEISVDGVRKTITFIDTPGHEAFSQMRGRGTQAADIGILVVSSVDGVMPQTRESIEILKKAQIPYIVTLTKADIQDKNEEKAKGQLIKEGVMLEGQGGDVPFISVSAKANTNIKELLELILLVSDMKQKPVSDTELKGVIIESRLDEGSGPRATVVVRSGKLTVAQMVDCEGIKAKVKTLMSDKGMRLKEAGVGQAVEVLGFEKVPPVGGTVLASDKTKAGTPQALNSPAAASQPSPSSVPAATSMPEDFLSEKESPVLSIVLRADTEGSLEAIIKSLPKEINIAFAKTGDITTTDILLAKSINAIALGFNIKIRPEIVRFAAQEKVLAKNYKIIYELISELKDVLKGKQLEMVEEIYGRAKVLASFPFEKSKVLGVKVLEGRVARGDKARIIRKEEIVGEGTVSSVRVAKQTVSKIGENQEGGIIINPPLDFTIGDMVICHG